MQRATIRAARPYVIRGVISTVIALAGLVTADLFGQLKDVEGPRGDEATHSEVLFALVGAGVLLLFGVAAVRSFAGAVRKGSEAREATSRGASLAFMTSIVGYGLVTIAILMTLGIDLGGLLLSGAVAGVVLGIAAQQTIGNFFAGIVLLVLRPFSVGDQIVLRSGPLGGEYSGSVTNMTLYYVHLLTVNGPVALPNAGVLASAVGPGARSATAAPVEDEG